MITRGSLYLARLKSDRMSRLVTSGILYANCSGHSMLKPYIEEIMDEVKVPCHVSILTLGIVALEYTGFKCTPGTAVYMHVFCLADMTNCLLQRVGTLPQNAGML